MAKFICDNVHEAGGPCAKWNKPEEQGIYLWSHSDMESEKKKKSQTHKNRGDSGGYQGWGVGEMEVVVVF